MKTTILIFSSFMLLAFSIQKHSSVKSELVGAWERESEGDKITWICSEKHFAVTIYNLSEKKFVGTYGGSWRTEGNKFLEVHEFNTMSPDQVGKEKATTFEVKKGKLVFKRKDKKEELTQIDNGTPGELAGAWLITGRMNDGEMQKITPGARRTMKILSGTRFQWIAYNADTKEFFGTGGGTYTTKDSKYTENIEFFSRDNSRVGISLSFEYALEDGNWRHKGSSSKGDPIDEVWTKREKIGI